MVSLTEHLDTVSGSSEDGNYVYDVEVWRADVLALCNLRVRLKVYEVTHRPFILPNSRKVVYQDTEVASTKSLDSTVEQVRGRAESMVQRYEERWC